jgi:ABC-type multidrug transport system fused ATPase/permease subunit
MTIARQILRLLTRDQRRSAVVMLGFMFIATGLETLGIGLVIPMLALLSQNDLAVRYPAIVPWLARLGNPDHQQLVVIAMSVLLAISIIKAGFLGFLAWVQTRFAFRLQASLSERLFAGYLRQPYTFHLQRNTAQLILTTINQTTAFAAVLQQGLIFVAEMLVVAGIFALLLTVEPVGAILVVSTLGLAAWGFNRFTRNYLVRLGAAFQRHEGLRIQHLQQGLGGVKDVKLLGREQEFLDQYHVHNAGSARANQHQATIGALPRIWLELLAVMGLVALVFVMLWRGKSVEALLPTLGLFAAAAFRLMPSVNRVANAAQSLRFNAPMISMLCQELDVVSEGTTQRRGEKLPFEREIKLDHVRFQYPSSNALVLTDVSIAIARGTTVGIIGSSGAGKSTLVDVILGLLRPGSGSVRVDGVDIQTSLRGWQDQIGYVPQTIYLTDDTLRRNIAFGLAADAIDDTAVARAIEGAQLGSFVRELPDGVNTIVGERGVRLSGGQRQRIGIARALYHNPSVLVLDEATSSLDMATERSVMDTVRGLRAEKTVIIIAHRLSTVEGCDRLFRIEGGRLVDEGETAGVMKRALQS